jgi:uncharacterized protein DUF2868
MNLANLIDLEAQLARDREIDPAALAARDRALLGAERPGDGAPPTGRARAALLDRWLEALREREPAALRPGRAVAGALATLRGALGLLGLALGWGAGAAVMRSGGAHPVNVWDFLLAFVGVQVLLLALLLASFLLPLAAAGAPVAGLVRGALGALVPRVAARLSAPARRRAAEWQTFWHRARSRRSLYHAVEPWLLLSLTQAFGVAFNLGLLAAVLRLVVFTDVAFGWSTTLLELDAPRFHALASALAWPWRALWPDALPSEALVAATRYSHLEGAYLAAGAGRSASPELVGGWWPFLVAAAATYGLLPRLALLVLSRARAARLLARLPLDDAEVSRLVARLAAPSLESRALAPEPGASPRLASAARAPTATPGTPCAVVLWRDVPGGPALEAAVGRAVGRPVARARAAGGRDGGEPGADWGALADGADPVVVVAEAFEPPDRGLRRLLSELRRAAGPRRLLVVLLVGAERGAAGAPRPPRSEDVATWRDALEALEDPHVAVEPLEEVS